MELGLASGRQFRAYREFSANTVLRFVATKPFMLTDQSLYVGAGAARVVISIGGTEGGSWAAVSTLFPKNAKINKASGVTISSGGTITGSTEREVILASSGAGVGIMSSRLGARVLPAGTYYMTITVTGTTNGIYSLEFEELS